ncbi:MAG: DMT family transporter [Nostocoides sp.]
MPDADPPPAGSTPSDHPSPNRPDLLPRLATVLLVGVTAVWGSTFFLIHDLVQTIPASDFLAVRFTIAAVVMVAAFWGHLRALASADLRIGALLGGLYGAAQLLQTMGLAHTDASTSGFITGTYVIFTPLLAAIVFAERVGPAGWVGTALAAAGLGVLSLYGLSAGVGEAQTLVAAGLYAAHIVGLGRWSRADNALGLATVQAAVIAILCTLAALPGGIQLPESGGQWTALVYMALVAGAGALWAQTWAQSHLSATSAAIVMTLEPVFAAGFAVALGGESLTARMIVGGGLVVLAMYVVELGRMPSGRASAQDAPPSEALHHEV